MQQRSDDRPRGIEIKDLKRFLKSVSACASGIYNMTSSPIELRSVRGRPCYCIAVPEIASTVVSAEEGDLAPQIHVVPLQSASLQQYWLGVGLQFVSLGKGVRSVHLEQLSIPIYRGELDAMSKVLLVRGEWDFRLTPQSRESRHAQPHWHVHPASRDQAIPTSENPLSAIHYAMASNWHTRDQKTAIVEFVNAELVVDWIGEVLRYVIEQIRYATDDQDFLRAGL